MTRLRALVCVLTALLSMAQVAMPDLKRDVSGKPLPATDLAAGTISVRVIKGSFDKNLYGLDATTGAERWRLPTEGAIRSSAVADGATAFVGNDDGNVRAVGIAEEAVTQFLGGQQ